MTITIENTDSPISLVRKIRSIKYPASADSMSDRGIESHRSSPSVKVVYQTMNPPKMTNSPWAKLNTLLAR